MNSGLLWYDADPKKPVQGKIDEAAQRFREKFGVDPNACHVSPGAPVTHKRFRIVPNRWIRPNYFWLGIDDQVAS